MARRPGEGRPLHARASGSASLIGLAIRCMTARSPTLDDPMTEPLRVGVAGLGTVGAAVVRILARQDNALAERCGRPVRVTAVSARSRAKERGLDLSGPAWVDDPGDLPRSRGGDRGRELLGGGG